jgi:hypothetical protein
MHKVITLEVQIENNSTNSLYINYEFLESIYTQYDSHMDYDRVKGILKKCLSKMENFTRLTATLTVRSQGDYSQYNKSMIESFRFVNSYGDVQFSEMIDGCYPNFKPSNKKLIYTNIKKMVENANVNFVRLLRNNTELITN